MYPYSQFFLVHMKVWADFHVRYLIKIEIMRTFHFQRKIDRWIFRSALDVGNISHNSCILLLEEFLQNLLFIHTQELFPWLCLNFLAMRVCIMLPYSLMFLLIHESFFQLLLKEHLIYHHLNILMHCLVMLTLLTQRSFEELKDFLF